MLSWNLNNSITHTDLGQLHPATVTSVQAPSRERRVADHSHWLHFLPTPVWTQDAAHIDGWPLNSGTLILLFSGFTLSVPSSLSVLVPWLSTGSSPGSWAAVFVSWKGGDGGPSPLPGSHSALLLLQQWQEGRILWLTAPSFLLTLKKQSHSQTPSCCHMWTPHFSTFPAPSYCLFFRQYYLKQRHDS